MSEERITDTDTETVHTDTETATDNDYSSLSDEEFRNLYNNNNGFNSSNQSNESDSNVDTSSTPEPEPDTEQTDTETQSTDTNDENTEETKDNTTENVNYKEFYDYILSEFKANGKMIKPQTKEDVRSLMQMGANYGKKMTIIKNYAKQIQSLEDADVKDLNSLNFLLDVYKGDKEAIKKLIKDKNIDPYELQDLEEVNYQNTGRNIISDNMVEFNNVLNEIKESEYFNDIHNTLENVWDSKSKQMVLNDTEVLKGLQYEFESGRFNEIQSEVDRQRQFGRLLDKNDLEAYRIVLANKLHAEQQQIEQQQQIKKLTKPKVTNKDIDVNKASTQPTQSNKNNKPNRLTDEEIARLSDEEFDELYKKGYFN